MTLQELLNAIDSFDINKLSTDELKKLQTTLDVKNYTIVKRLRCLKVLNHRHKS